MHCFLHKQFICQECGLGLDASVSRPFRDAVVPRLGLTSELVRLVSVSSSEGLGLGLASAWIVNALVLPWSRASKSWSRLGLN